MGEAVKKRPAITTGILLIAYILEGKAQELTTLLHEHPYININAKSETGVFPFHLACLMNQKAVLEVLLRHRPDFLQQNNEGKTPIEVAAENNKRDSVHLLILHGSPVPLNLQNLPVVREFLDRADDFQGVDDAIELNDHNQVVEQVISKMTGEEVKIKELEDFSGVHEFTMAELEDILEYEGELYSDKFYQWIRKRLYNITNPVELSNFCDKVLEELVDAGEGGFDFSNNEMVDKIFERYEERMAANPQEWREEKTVIHEATHTIDEAAAKIDGQGEENIDEINNAKVVKGEGVTKEQVQIVEGGAEAQKPESKETIHQSTEHIKEDLIRIKGGAIDAPEVEEEEEEIDLDKDKNNRDKKEKGIRPEVLLGMALKKGEYAMAEKIVSGMNFDVNVRDSRGNTFLMVAMAKSQNNLARLLLDRGAANTLNYRSPSGITALSAAVKAQNLEGLKILIDKGVNLNIRFKKENALMYAAWKGNMDMIKILIDGEIDIYAKDIRGNTALDYARNGGKEDVIKFLSKKFG